MKILGYDITKGAIKLTGRFGRIFSPLLGSVELYNDDYETYINEGYNKNDVIYQIVSDTANAVSKAKWKTRDKVTKKDVYVEGFEMLKRNATPDLKTLNEVTQEGVTQKMLTGNAYYACEKGKGFNKSIYTRMYIVPSTYMRIRSSAKAIIGYEPNVITGFEGYIPASEVLHLRNVNASINSTDTSEWFYGQPTFRAARNSIRSYNDSIVAGAYFLQNKGAQKALLLDPNAILGTKGETALKRKLRSTAQGQENNANIPILEGVKGVIDLSADPKKALVLEQRDKAAMEMARAAKYPPQRLGLKDGTYQNAKEGKKGFWEDCVIPELDEIERGFNIQLAPTYGDNIEVYYDISHVDAVQEDKLMKGKALQAFAGTISNNEWRIMAGIGPTDEAWGEERYVGFVQAVEEGTSDSDA